MEVKTHAVLEVKKGENFHQYHVPPSASLGECYDAVREMLGHIGERLKQDLEAQKAPEKVVPMPAEPEAEQPAQQ